eukprot:CAMPEP_0202476242 /NCGR_PEP_ID=MMETSP1360-20130828/93321_1 /ASSEMBLY_ACC=CAM_ASM_000848 /TAXON_ID=515479 /ORGANISM="Licmophora paradoxa, Strain CCMP2313" /LENGTH=139 /DNA_ID=CAMNT_0049103441 /DNA_START=617 /DNA_END=1036 /DNA_ORIENTATION=-
MAEAKKMMEDPDFQKQMKELSQNHAFKEATKKSIDMLKDPTESARVEAQMEHMMKIGEEKLKKGAANVMEEAMASMGNPEVMAKMTDMLKDPAFQQQIAKMAQDPSFKNYINAMKDMMKDPEKKQRFEELSEQLRSSKS